VDPGHVSYTYGARLPAPVVRARRRAASCWMHAVLRPGGDTAAPLSVAVLPVNPVGPRAPAQGEPDALALRIRGARGAGGGEDYILIGSDDGATWLADGERFSGCCVRHRPHAGAAPHTEFSFAGITAVVAGSSRSPG